ncbi:MAG: hypothetical protein A3F78_02590 [Burkholderiales bacterium RIFCSPLOWO2_12_FULL_61_40]|nr:MAG: hypothetical protein A3F78_02590 [Burkholderiales bacterium RIFCSPLOWO2_12_FULL_61_40]
MKTTPVNDLRHYSRIPFAAEVQLHLRGQTFRVQLVDIALKGALVQTDTVQALELHEPCRLVLPLADEGEGVVMAGRIVHLNGPHIGIECQDIDVTSLTRLRRLLELNTGDTALMDRELSHLFARH